VTDLPRESPSSLREGRVRLAAAKARTSAYAKVRQAAAFTGDSLVECAGPGENLAARRERMEGPFAVLAVGTGALSTIAFIQIASAASGAGFPGVVLDALGTRHAPLALAAGITTATVLAVLAALSFLSVRALSFMLARGYSRGYAETALAEASRVAAVGAEAFYLRDRHGRLRAIPLATVDGVSAAPEDGAWTLALAGHDRPPVVMVHDLSREDADRLAAAVAARIFAPEHTPTPV